MIFAPYLALILVVAVGATALVVALINRGDGEAWMATAERTTHRADVYMQQLEREHVAALYAATHDPALADALRGEDAAGVSRILASHLGRLEADAVDVVTPDRTFASMVSTAGPAEPRLLVRVEPTGAARSWAMTTRALAGEQDGFGETWTGLVDAPLGTTIYSAAPVRAGDRVAGAVLIGTTLQRAIERAARAAGGDISVYDANGRVLASTVSEVCCHGGWTPGAPMPADMARGVVGGRATVLREFSLPGAVYREHVRALRLRGEVVAAIGGVVKAPPGVRGQAMKLVAAFAAVICTILSVGLLATRRAVSMLASVSQAKSRFIDWRSAPHHVVHLPVEATLSGRLN